MSNSYFQFKAALLATMGISSSLLMADDAKEIWYNAKGEPILAIDKKTGKRISLEVLKKEALIDEFSKEAQAESSESKNEAGAGAEAEIPLVLQHKNTEVDTRFYWSPRDTYYSRNRSGYGYGHYGYGYRYGSRVLPRFSRNGYYGPARFLPQYHPSRGGSSRFRYHGSSYRYRHNGFLLQYSRPNFSIRARF